jgi:hypothetical protein
VTTSECPGTRFQRIHGVVQRCVIHASPIDRKPIAKEFGAADRPSCGRHARICLMTLPSTSVRRKSRPAW